MEIMDLSECWDAIHTPHDVSRINQRRLAMALWVQSTCMQLSTRPLASMWVSHLVSWCERLVNLWRTK